MAAEHKCQRSRLEDHGEGFTARKAPPSLASRLLPYMAESDGF